MQKNIMTFFFLLLFIGCLQAQEEIQTKVESNVVYGRYGGLALLMDVHKPENTNGFGIVVIAGCGWHRPFSYDAAPIGEAWYFSTVLGIDELLKNGYTIFTIQHRAAPVFRYPAAVEDAQRAVQFIRHNANRFGIDSMRIGAVGHSSGGHLVSMLGTLDNKKDINSADSISQKSSKVQAVVALSPPTDLFKFVREGKGDLGAASSFIGVHFMGYYNPELPTVKDEYALFTEASPVTHVSADDPPFLIVHGDKDETVPLSQAEVFVELLRKKGVDTKYITIENGGHLLGVVDGDNWEVKSTAYFDHMVELFDRHLRDKK